MLQINKQYRELIEKIKTDSEKYTDAEMKSIYKEQNASLKTLEALLGAMFIKYGVNGLLRMTSKQKGSMGLKQMLKSMGKTLGTSEIAKVTDILGSVFKDTYYKNAFTMEMGMPVNLKFDIIKKEFIDKAVNKKFKGELFSDRIWKNKSLLINRLQGSLEDVMKGKTTIDKVARDIKTTFNRTAYESRRIAQTEVGRMAVDAQDAIARSSGVEEVIWNAVLDDRTVDYDASLDGKVWGINKNHPRPIYDTHPLCRCLILSVPYKNWSPTSRKDNKTKEVITYTNYSDWAKEKGINKTKS